MFEVNNKIFEVDKETFKFMRSFKTVIDKKNVAFFLADETVEKGINTPILSHYYENEQDFIIKACINFGLMHFMEEDFYIVKEILGFNYVINILNNQLRYLS